MKFAAILSITILSTPGFAQTQKATPFLPMDHWAYDYIDILQTRGHLPDLFIALKPYSWDEIASAMAKIDTSRLSPAEYTWVKTIFSEIRTQTSETAARYKVTSSTALDLSDKDMAIRPAVFPEIAVLSSHFTGTLRGRIDKSLKDDPDYTGRKTDWVGARIEDGYGLLRLGIVSLYVGRFSHSWSPFLNNSLIMSSNPYTYDQAGLVLKTKTIAFSAFHSQLSSTGNIRRYLAAHRVDIKLPRGIQIGFTETVLYGGADKQVELAYVNPFTSYMSIQLNEKKEANGLLAFDAYLPFKRNALKLQVLVDDFILDGASSPPPNRKTSNDRLGLVVGFAASDLVVSNSLSEIEYTRVGSYTYNVKSTRPWQAYLNDSRGLGAHTNDYDRLQYSLQYFPILQTLFFTEIGLQRTGQRTLASNNFVDSTYIKLPFPSGIVESKVDWALGLRHIHSRQWHTTFVVRTDFLRSAGNIKGKSEIRLFLNLRSEFSIDRWHLQL